MFRITVSDTGAQATASLSSHLDQLRKQHKVLVTAALPAFVSMARVEAGESVLDINCGDGELLAEIAVTAGESAGCVVGLDNNLALLQSAKAFLKSKNLKQYVRLFRVDLLNTDTNVVTGALTDKNLPTTFDTIFAVDILPPNSAARVTALRSLASRLTSTSGRLIATFRHADGTLGEIAGAVRFTSQNNVHYRTSWMLEAEWVRAEAEVRALADGAGLRVNELRRVGFHGAEAGLWFDDSARVDVLTRGRLTNNDTDAHGNPSVEFKNGVKQELANLHNDSISSESDEDVLVGACLVAVLVK